MYNKLIILSSKDVICSGLVVEPAEGLVELHPSPLKNCDIIAELPEGGVSLLPLAHLPTPLISVIWGLGFSHLE